MHGPCRRVCDDLNGEDTRTSAESSYTTQLRVQVTTHTHTHTVTAQQLSFECLQRSPGRRFV